MDSLQFVSQDEMELCEKTSKLVISVYKDFKNWNKLSDSYKNNLTLSFDILTTNVKDSKYILNSVIEKLEKTIDEPNFNANNISSQYFHRKFAYELCVKLNTIEIAEHIFTAFEYMKKIDYQQATKPILMPEKRKLYFYCKSEFQTNFMSMVNYHGKNLANDKLTINKCGDEKEYENDLKWYDSMLMMSCYKIRNQYSVLMDLRDVESIIIDLRIRVKKLKLDNMFAFMKYAHNVYELNKIQN